MSKWDDIPENANSTEELDTFESEMCCNGDSCFINFNTEEE